MQNHIVPEIIVPQSSSLRLDDCMLLEVVAVQHSRCDYDHGTRPAISASYVFHKRRRCYRPGSSLFGDRVRSKQSGCTASMPYHYRRCWIGWFGRGNWASKIRTSCNGFREDQGAARGKTLNHSHEVQAMLPIRRLVLVSRSLPTAQGFWPSLKC